MGVPDKVRHFSKIQRGPARLVAREQFWGADRATNAIFYVISSSLVGDAPDH
jgi:hypothetical protein